MPDALPERRITLTVNGKEHSAVTEDRYSLADFLRHGLGLTGTHLGCEHGVCGACTVLVDGEAVRGCLMLAVQAEGRQVTTIEGLAGDDGTLSPLQAAFMDNHGLQCGFCTPGILTTLTAYLRDNPDADEPELREALSGNICRCTGYDTIVRAALAAADAMRKGATA
ncbi:MAG TPA: 4-hydroxybenzoyl-CoA reductase subunit gamma [Rhodospirillaceae bacterium]|nr:4-hydroxybenzoyl-CoA reductase subunit gamma [Magnetovibrio sp.]HCS70352.1 4-hydroxybenzoyl-CoA reductase subunit gamma [Rhodospirillaceae bacterium]|tara:strand:- start:604 stop:1104 length:501 start_codon:yes stop_codon:yes gene_type:complete